MLKDTGKGRLKGCRNCKPNISGYLPRTDILMNTFIRDIFTRTEVSTTSKQVFGGGRIGYSEVFGSNLNPKSVAVIDTLFTIERERALWYSRNQDHQQLVDLHALSANR